MAVEDVVKVEPVGEFELKGIRRPLAAYNVVAAASSTVSRKSRERLIQFCERGLDSREYRGLSELGEYPFCLAKVFKRQRALLLSLV